MSNNNDGDGGGANINYARPVGNNTFIRPGITNLDPFALRKKKGKKVVFLKNRKARIKFMKEKRAEEERYEKERVEPTTTVQNKRQNQIVLGLYVMNGDLNEEQFKALSSTKFASTKLGDITYSVVEIIGRGTRLQKLFSYTTEYGFTYNKKKYDFPEYASLDFKIKMRGPGGEEKFGLVTVNYRSFKFIVRGGYFDCTSKNGFKGFDSQPQNLLKSVFKIFAGSQAPQIPSMKRSNTVASFRTGKKFNYKKFARNKPNVGAELNLKNKGPTRVYFKLPGDHVMSITNNGVIQVSFKKSINKDTIKNTFSKIVGIQRKLAPYFGGAVVAPTVKSKAAVRKNAAPAPNVARRGTTCPAGKRPEPYSFTGKCPPGMYVRPNPQKQPCCYKIPKQRGYYRNKIVSAYAAAGVSMPDSVANIFALPRTRATINTNITNVGVTNVITKTKARVRQSNGTMKTINTIKIGSRQCIRYSKQQILNLLLRTGYAANGLERKSKEELCEILTRQLKNNNVNKTNVKFVPKVGDKLLTRTGAGALVIGGRQCNGYSKTQLQKFCRNLGINFTDLTRDEMCAKLEDKRKSMQNSLNKRKNTVANKAREAAKNRANAQKTAMNKKRNDRLYSEFLGRIQGFLTKYKAVNAKNTVPTQNQFLNHFKISVNQGFAKNITNVSKKGWRAGFQRWLDDYILQYKSVYEPKLVNNMGRKAARNQEELRKKREAREAEKARVTISLEDAKKQLRKKLRPMIDKKLQPAFNARLNKFAQNLKNSVNKGTYGNKTGRVRAFLTVNAQSNTGPIRRYLESVVAKLKPIKLNENRIQRYELSQNFKVVKGVPREVL